MAKGKGLLIGLVIGKQGIEFLKTVGIDQMVFLVEEGDVHIVFRCYRLRELFLELTGLDGIGNGGQSICRPLIDGIAGGGGIIALPAYLITGMPPQNAYACNKIQSCLGTSCSAAKFIKDKYVDFKTTQLRYLLR